MLQVRRGGKLYEQEYQHGVPQKPLAVIGESEATGTSLRFWPSDDTFTGVEFHYDI